MEIKLTKWQVRVANEAVQVPAQVPGDITNDLHKAGVIADPFFGLNHLDLREWLDKDYIYSTEFEVKQMPSEKEDVFIAFDGIDLFADIYLNGVLLGKTDNMFKKYIYDISDKFCVGKNIVEVHMHSTTKYMETLANRISHI